MTCSPVIPVGTDVGERIAARALALLGTPFRLHGRCPEVGVDCVGLVAEALAITGEEYEISSKYMLRGDHLDRVSAYFDRDCFFDVKGGGFRSGDILLLRPAVRQLHFAIFTGQGAVHAHAGLGRVVLTPLPLPWPVIGHWRVKGN